VHPPLGKWLIGLGIRGLGDDPVGWRSASVVFGALVVVLTYVLALRLFESVAWASLASALVATDGLQIVQSRVAMLEIFLSGFVLAGVLFAFTYTERSGAASRRAWPWLLAAGVMFGAALAVKWSALPVLVLASLGVIAASSNRRRAVALVVGLLGVVAAAVYVASYGRFWARYGGATGAWADLQWSMLRFHRGALPSHLYASPSLSWLLLRRPVAYFFRTRDDRTEHIVALGNPLLWWAFLASIPLLVRAWLRRTDRAADIVVLALAALYMPWLLVRRTSFLYYLTPLVPFMALGVTWSLQQLCGSSLPRAIRSGTLIAYIGATFLSAALLLPVWLGLPIEYHHWRRLMVFRSWI
jgi:dolichyl-phosphate-mannose--protein O-mannosyl transferase